MTRTRPLARLRAGFSRRPKSGATPRGSTGMISCKEVGRLLQQYLDGELGEAERAGAIAAHLDDCVRCGLEADTYRRIIAAVSTGGPALPADAMLRLRDFGLRLAAGEAGPNRSGHPR